MTQLIILYFIFLGLLSLLFLLNLIYIIVHEIVKFMDLFKVTNLNSPGFAWGDLNPGFAGNLNSINTFKSYQNKLSNNKIGKRWLSTFNTNRNQDNLKDKSIELDINKGSIDTSKAIKKFSDVVINSAEIKAFIKNKSGIYMWKNIINNKVYVGSSLKLNRRFTEYLNINELKKRNYMAINKALLKYNYDNFEFYILEFCDISKLHEREKFYIDQIINGYNILKTPGSPSRKSGWKHTPEALNLINEAAYNNAKKPNHISKITSISVKVFDVLNSEITYYKSIRDAARGLKKENNNFIIDRDIFTKRRYNDINNLYKGRYYFKLSTPSVLNKTQKQSNSATLIFIDLKTNETQIYFSAGELEQKQNLNKRSVKVYTRKNTSKPFLNRYIIIHLNDMNKFILLIFIIIFFSPSTSFK